LLNPRYEKETGLRKEFVIKSRGKKADVELIASRRCAKKSKETQEVRLEKRTRGRRANPSTINVITRRGVWLYAEGRGGKKKVMGEPSREGFPKKSGMQKKMQKA